MQKNSNTVTVPPFLMWRRRLNLSRTDAAKLLGRTERQIQTYDQICKLPPLVMLALAALEYLPVWRLIELGIDPTWRRKH